MLYAATPTNSRVIAAGGRMMGASSAPLPETRRPGLSNHKKMTKFRMAALECAQSYLTGRGHSQLLGRSEDEFAGGRTMYRGPMLPHCTLGGEPSNKAANSEPEQIT